MTRPDPITPVSFRYGSPMGRTNTVPALDTSPRSVRLFRVPLDSGGYDKGGAYWGNSPTGCIYCAQDQDGDIQFTRATSRLDAAMKLDLDPRALIIGLRVPSWWRELPTVAAYLRSWA